MQLFRDLTNFAKEKLPPSIKHGLRTLRQELGDTASFSYQGYRIPRKLMRLAGDAPEVWPSVSAAHAAQYDRYCPVGAEAFVVDVGCGIGKDAMVFSKRLSPRGRYLGVDIIRPSIEWCQRHITARHPNFEFVYFDIQSQIHNASGKRRTPDFKLPVEDGAVDLVILQSVFTHMFEEDIVHYLREFRRILKPEGQVFATFFLVDEARLHKVRGNDSGLTFRHARAQDCFVEVLERPEGAVAYTEPALERMLGAARLELSQPIHFGFWSGEAERPDGQDVVVLKKSDTPE